MGEGNRPHEQPIAPEAHCLGSPAHLMPAEVLLCSTCGALRAGALVDGYQIQQFLGKGRCGSAYLGFHQELLQYDVLKLVPSNLASNELWLLAHQEVRAISALQHPSCLPVFRCTFWSPTKSSGKIHEGWRRPEDVSYLLTRCQYVPRGNWARLLSDSNQRLQGSREDQRETLLAQLVLSIQQIGAALTAVHQMGMVHGALVPGNILWDQQQLWIADWGMARLTPPLSPFLAPELRSYFQPAQSADYQLWYWYAATPASDQYALAVLFQPVLASLLAPAYYQHVFSLLKRATHEQPQQRFTSVKQFVNALEDFMDKIINKRSHIRSHAIEDSGEYMQDSPVPSAWGESWERAGRNHFAEGDYEEALQAYQLAVDLDATNGTLWCALGDTYLALGRYQEALHAYDQALTLQPRDVVIWENKETVLALMGRHAEAWICHEQIKQLREEE